MFEILSFLIAFFGTLIASYYDLKTTEIPDLLPILLILLGIITNVLNYSFTKNFEVIRQMLFNGFLFSIIGFSMYFFGQWGMGDAFLLSAIGFISPINIHFKSEFPFFFDYLTNLFFLGTIYMIFYSLIYTIKNKKVLKFFEKDLRNNALSIGISFFVLLFLSIFISYWLFNQLYFKLILLTIAFTYLLMILLIFSKSVEKTFVKKIPVFELKAGDVLKDSKRWDGITEEEVKKIKKSGKKYVYIKIGVPFAPSFLIALLFTLLIGNSLFWLLKFVGNLI
ncbi:MAG: prepilin peptidase [Candidatus Aenigmatarchaeota archaeon]